MHDRGLRERKKLESWRTIRMAALRLMADRGFEAVSIDDIARAADVSRTTFFNYFASKEAVVFDPDPEDRKALHELMAARPAAEPLWASLQVILIENVGRYADRLPMQKKLKAASPKLAASSRDVTDNFGYDLRRWVSSRTPESEAAAAALQVNVAMAVAGTAYEQWDPESPFSDLVDLLAVLFASATAGFPGGPRTSPAATGPSTRERRSEGHRHGSSPAHPAASAGPTAMRSCPRPDRD